MKPKTPYAIMKSAIDKSFNPTDEELKKINSFFLTRFTSNDPSTIYISNILNCYSKYIPIEAQYKFIRNSTMNNIAFINYPKKIRVTSDKNLKVLMKYFKCNERVAKDYAKILGEEKIEEIITKYSPFL